MSQLAFRLTSICWLAPLASAVMPAFHSEQSRSDPARPAAAAGESAASRDDVRVEQIRQEIAQTLREMEELATSGLEPGPFYAAVLERVIRVCGAEAGAIWIAGAGDALHLFAQQSLSSVVRGRQRTAIDRERGRLSAWLAANPTTCDGLTNRPPQAPAEGAHLTGETLASRIQPGGSLWGVLTVYLDEATEAAALAGLGRFVDAVARAATDYQAQSELRRWNQDRDALTRLHDLTMAVHRPWPAREVYASIASEGRRFLDCDRVAIAVRRGRRYRLVAASGAATLNSRSAELQKLERLTTAAMRSRQALFYDETPAERSPQIERPLQAYLDESAARRLAILPLDPQRDDEQDRSQASAALIVEQMSERPLDASWQALWLLADHAAVAVDRATRLGRLPLFGPLLGVPSIRRAVTRRWLPRGLLAAALVGGFVAALCLVQTDYRVRVVGELIPTTQRHVFAPADGVVVDLLAKHGDRVTAGQPLAVLRSPDLEREATRLRGAIATSERRLAAAQTARLEALSTGSPRGASEGQLASEQLIVEQELRALRDELLLLDEEREKLTVTSPIAGAVITWDVSEALAARPVEQGQRLLTVADLGDEWRLRFRAPDRSVGPILAAQRESTRGAAVQFVTAARPEQTYLARAENFRLASEANPATGANELLFEARLTGDATPELRPGAEVLGRVDCGRRSLAYVWLGEVYEEFRRWFF